MTRKLPAESLFPSDPALEISSLIDVCFLLLIYFLITSTITPRESDLGLQLPGDPSTAPNSQEFDSLLIQIHSSGSISTGLAESQLLMDTDSSQRSLPLLESQLRMYSAAARAANTQPIVQIDASSEATQQRVIDVLNALASVSIRSVTFTDRLGGTALD